MPSYAMVRKHSLEAQEELLGNWVWHCFTNSSKIDNGSVIYEKKCGKSPKQRQAKQFIEEQMPEFIKDLLRSLINFGRGFCQKEEETLVHIPCKENGSGTGFREHQR